MRVRVEGTPAETTAAVARIATVLDVQETSRFYPNRGSSQLGRIYLTTAAPGAGPIHVPADRADRTTSVWNQLQAAEHHAELTADQEWGPA